MIEDILDFCMQYIILPFCCIVAVGFICLCCVGIFMIPSCIRHNAEQERQLEECFKQDPKTKDCEYMIWKYEVKNSKPRQQTTVMPIPVVVR